MPDFSVLVVNLNNLDFTRNCLRDLLHQDTEFNLHIIDQASSEHGTSDFLKKFVSLNNNRFPFHKISLTFNEQNIPLNKLWNEFVENSETEYLCVLNNDTRLSPNFLSSSKQVFDAEPEVGFVNHASNRKEYSRWSYDLKYEVINSPYRQGWDPIFRKDSYSFIPEDLTFFYGDDYIYSKLYNSGKKGAYVLNSPILHFERSTTHEKGGQRDCSLDGEYYSRLHDVMHNLSFSYDFSAWKPEFQIIKF